MQYFLAVKRLELKIRLLNVTGAVPRVVQLAQKSEQSKKSQQKRSMLTHGCFLSPSVKRGTENRPCVFTAVWWINRGRLLRSLCQGPPGHIHMWQNGTKSILFSFGFCRAANVSRVWTPCWGDAGPPSRVRPTVGLELCPKKTKQKNPLETAVRHSENVNWMITFFQQSVQGKKKTMWSVCVCVFLPSRLADDSQPLTHMSAFASSLLSFFLYWNGTRLSALMWRSVPRYRGPSCKFSVPSFIKYVKTTSEQWDQRWGLLVWNLKTKKKKKG